METRVGISGWRYGPWRGVFYPTGLPQDLELWYASRRLNSVEINGSFYSLQTPASYQKWYQQTPKGFVFAVKGPRYITHIRRLNQVRGALGNFFASGVLHLREKLGPILWQFPPNFLFHEEKLAKFFEMLPHSVAQAIEVARWADRLNPDWPSGAEHLKKKIRHAIEIRNPTFENPDFIALLRHHGIALVFADTAGKWPYMEDLTSDFVYLRLHGEKVLYASGYTPTALDWWAERISCWRKGKQSKDAFTITDEFRSQRRSVFVYFDNDVKVKAPFNAMDLSKRLFHYEPLIIPRGKKDWRREVREAQASWPRS